MSKKSFQNPNLCLRGVFRIRIRISSFTRYFQKSGEEKRRRKKNEKIKIKGNTFVVVYISY